MSSHKRHEYNSKYKSIFNKLSARYDIPAEDIEEYVDDLFIQLKEWIRDPRMPKIQITNLGSFIPSKGQINRALSKSFYWYRGGNKSRENMIKLVRKLWPVRNRINQEKKGIQTWKKWSKMDPKSLTDHTEDSSEEK